MLLADGQRRASAAGAGVEAARKGAHEGVHASQPRGPLDVFPSGARIAEGDVVGHRVVKDECLLEDEGRLFAQAVEAQIGCRHAVERHAAGGRLHEPREQVGQRALAGAGGAGQGDHLAHPAMQRDVVQRRRAVRIAVARVLDAHFGHAGNAPPSLPLRLHLGIRRLEHAPHAGDVVLQIEPGGTQRADVAHDLQEVGVDDAEVAGGHAPAHHGLADGEEDVEHQPGANRRLHGQRQQHHGEIAAKALEGARAVGGDLVALAVLGAEALHGHDVAHALFGGGGRLGAGQAAGQRTPSGHAGHQERHKQHEGRRQARHDDDFRHRAEAVRRRPDHRRHHEHGRHRQHQHVVADPRDGRRVVHRAVHGVADAGVGEARQRPVQHPPEDQAAQGVVDAVRDAQLVAVLEEAEQAAHAAARLVGLVLALGGGVHALRQLAFGAVPGHAAAERASQNHAEQAHGDNRQRDLQRRQPVQQLHEPCDVGRIRRRRRAHRQAHHHMVDENLQRPRQEQHDGQPDDGERQLDADLPPVRPDEAQRPGEQRERLAAGDALRHAA